MKFILKKVLTKLILPPPTFSLFLTQASLYSEISEGSCNFSLLGVFTFCSPSICISSRKSRALHLPLQTVKLYFFFKKKKKKSLRPFIIAILWGLIFWHFYCPASHDFIIMLLRYQIRSQPPLWCMNYTHLRDLWFNIKTELLPPTFKYWIVLTLIGT